MKTTVFFVLAVFLLFCSGAEACVGKTLNIGAVDSPEGQVLAEVLSNLINERTGTTVNVKFYKNTQELYGALKVNQVDILIENTATALRILNRPPESDVKKAYETVKTAYEKERGLIWLKPFGYLKGGGGNFPSHTATVLRVEVLNNFPALPRVLSKLADTISEETHSRMIKAVESGEKPRKVARDFLKSKKII